MALGRDALVGPPVTAPVRPLAPVALDPGRGTSNLGPEDTDSVCHLYLQLQGHARVGQPAAGRGGEGTTR